jgi:hypothetical protein
MDRQISSVASGGWRLLKTCTYFCIRDALMNPMKEVSVDIQQNRENRRKKDCGRGDESERIEGIEKIA